MQSTEYRVQSTEYRIEYKVQSTEYIVQAKKETLRFTKNIPNVLKKDDFSRKKNKQCDY